MKRLKKELKFSNSPKIKSRLRLLSKSLDLSWVKFSRVFTYSSTGSKARAYARTWGLPRIWQHSLKVEPAYIIEVLSERFDKLTESDKDRVLLHELTHIPKNFSGALVPHTHKAKGSFRDRLRKLYEDYHSARTKLG